jgi:hypothetical protein
MALEVYVLRVAEIVFQNEGSYLLVLKYLELFEGLSSTNCLCISRTRPSSMREVDEVLSI